MKRFLLIALVVAAIVVAVLYFTGYDVISQVTNNVQIKSLLPPRHILTNVVAGLISGFIVAIVTGMFARKS